MLEIILDLLANNAVLLQEHVSTDVVHGSLPKAAAALGVGLAALGQVLQNVVLVPRRLGQ